MSTPTIPTAKGKSGHLILIFESLIIGCITGLIVAAFRIGIRTITQFRIHLYPLLYTKNLFFIYYVLFLCVAGLLIGYIIIKHPIAKGGGVAQLEGVFMKKLALSPWPELPLKFIGGLLCIGLGLSVGREGPSVHLGAYIGDALTRLKKSTFLDTAYLIKAGAAAGLSATFNAPFTGVVFAVEDLHRSFSPPLLTCIMVSSCAADVIVSIFFGAGPLFHFNAPQYYPLHHFGWLIGLGVLTAFIGHLFKHSIYFFQRSYAKLHIPLYLRPVIPFLLTIPAGLWLAYITGGGDALIDALVNQPLSFSMVTVLLCTKIIFTGISAGSGAIGGIFVPLLSCGALTGLLYTKVLLHYGVLEPVHTASMLLFGMAACFTTVIKTPLSACALILETSGSFQHLGGLVLTCFVAYAVANCIGSPAHDQVLLAQFLDTAQKDTKGTHHA
ncbi:MAG: ClC family H(+)/Cl(-) exchange transporter [Treponema sp.]